MSASRSVTRAVSEVLDLAPRRGAVTLTGLVDAVAEDRHRPIELTMADLPPGVCGQWRQYADHDVFLIQQGLPAWDRTLAHELGHLVLGHEGISIVDAAQETVEVASSDLISYMLNQRTGCMGPNGEDIEQEAEDFAALLLYRLGRLPSDRSSIVQVRLGEAFG
ncbi:ImmA/IrrE family metallo-endopeptidase [Mycobacterium sp. NPDC003449]